MARILVVHESSALRLHATIEDHLASFRDHAVGHDVEYLNAALHIPRSIRRAKYALIVFHYTFLARRVSPRYFNWLCDRVSFLRDSAATKVIVPQDEQNRGDLLCRFINDFGVSHVFSCAGPIDWPRIYREIDAHQVGFDTVLTGYVSERTDARIQRMADDIRERSIAIGYRARDLLPCLGRHARLKGDLGRAFLAEAPRHGVTVDISLDPTDRIDGDAWFAFLLRCRYTIGVEGGASILDYDGSLEAATREYMQADPGASFEEIEAACFPGAEGSLELRAISPRHLEACMTRTCQVLVDGEYGSVLRPHEHYIPLRADMSNMADVLDTIARDDLREAMVERAYRDVVESGEWSYQRFVNLVLDRAGLQLQTEAPADTRPIRRLLDYPQLALRAVLHGTLDRLLKKRWFARLYARVRG
ncbi:MAG: hypothetical protein EG823_01530 [Actinobacteria bacterium]|nr:hypothetical protein [Actinomycetota bacterium]